MDKQQILKAVNSFRGANREFSQEMGPIVEGILDLIDEGGGGGSSDAVKYTQQELTEEQQSQARTNIGGASAASVIAERDRASAAELEIMDALDGRNAETVNVLPEASASTVGKIYYVGPDSDGEYARYRGIESGGSYSFLPLGSTEMNLTDYATEEELSQLDQKVDSSKDFQHVGGGTVFTPYDIKQGHTYKISVTGATIIISMQVGNSTSTTSTPIATLDSGGSATFTADADYDYIRTYKSSASTADLTIFDTSDIVSQLNSKVPKSDIDTIINEELVLTSDQDWGWADGYYNSSGTLVTTGVGPNYQHNEDYLPVVPGLVLDVVGSTINVPVIYYDINKEFVGASTDGSQTSRTITVPDGVYFIRLSYVKTSSLKIYLTNGIYQTAVQAAHGVDASGTDFDITPIAGKIYTRANDNSEDFVCASNMVYPEGFVSSDEDILTIDGGQGIVARGVADSVQSELAIHIVKDKTAKAVNIPVVGVDPKSLKGNPAFVLCIGESTTSAIVRNPYAGKTETPYGWPSAMQHFADLDNIDLGEITFKTIGTKHWANEQTYGKYTYKGNEYTPRSFNEGIGGWSSYSFLNLPCGARFGSMVLLDAAKLWYFLGLATKTAYSASDYNTPATAYTGSAEQVSEIISTPFGKYKIDGNSDLWNWMKTVGTSGNTDGYPVFSETGDYSGTAAQLAAMNTWGESLAASPINPFFSLTEARTGQSGTAFSLSTYLARYRTMDDAGERLTGSAGQSVTGSDGKSYTIGTEVTNTSDYDVCTPNVVIINVGINDGISPETPADYIGVVKKFVGQFSVPTAFFFTRIPGVCNPAAWANKTLAKKMDNAFYAFAHSVIPTLSAWFDEQADKYFLPVYHIQPPASVLYNFVEEDLSNGGTILNATNENVHPGWDAYRAIGLSCLAWVTFVVSQKAEPITITHEGGGNRYTRYDIKNGHKYNFAVTGANVLIGVCNSDSGADYVDWGTVSAGNNYTFTAAGDYLYIRTYKGTVTTATIVVTEV